MKPRPSPDINSRQTRTGPASFPLAATLGLVLLLGACSGTTTATSSDSFVADASLPPDVSGVLLQNIGELHPSEIPFFVTITAPPRGATLDGDKAVMVEGRVQGHAESLTLNGSALTPSADGSFSQVVDARHGMNILVLEAEGSAGDTQKIVQSFYYSTRWLQTSFADPQSAMIPDAVLGWLGQAIFDDGDPTTPNDFASVLEQVLAGYDLASMVPQDQRLEDVAGCDHADVDIRNIRYNAPTISLDVNEGEIVAKLTITGFEASVDADLDGPWYNPACLISVGGKIKASAITVTMKVGVTVVDGALKVEARETTAVVSGFDIDISGVWGFLTNWLVNTFEDDLEEDLEQQLAGELDAQLGTLLEQGLGDLSFDESFALDPLIGAGDPISAKVVSQLSAFDLLEGGVRFGLDATAVAESMIAHPSLGSIAHDQCDAGTGAALSFVDQEANPFQLAIHDDLVNQLLYSMHQGGLLRADLTEQDLGGALGGAGITDFEGSIDALLPPIFNSCTDDDGPLLQLGDLRMRLKFKLIGQPVEMQLHISFEAPVELDVAQDGDGQRLQFALLEVSRLEVESKDLSDGQSPIYDTVLRLLEGTLIPELLASFGDQSTSFAIPEIDLSSMHSSIPAGTKIKLELTRLEQREGYSVLVGNIE